MYNDLIKQLEEDFSNFDKVSGSKKKGLNESMLNEGEFSWLLPNGEPIYSTERHQKTVYMFDDKGNKWQEDAYEGYGVFGGKDYYELLAEMNGMQPSPGMIYGAEDSLRLAGIDAAFDESQTVKLPRFSTDPNAAYDQLPDPENDPGQGWYEGEEEEDEY